MTKEKFTSKAINDLITDKFSVFILQDKMKEGCGGWFDHEKKQFLCCMGNTLGFEILVHEYCHYLQWKTKTKYFKDLCKSTSMLFEWLDNPKSKLNQDQLQNVLAASIELEYDCEKMAIALIKKHKLDVDLDLYVRAANAYLMFYHLVVEHRQWSTDASPYNSKILKLVPNELQPLQFYMDPANISAAQRTQYLKILHK